MVKNLPAKAGDVRDSSSIPGLGGPPGLEMATHSSILAWRIPIDREAWWATVPRAAKESDVTLRLNKSYSKQLVFVSKLF